MRNRKTRTNTIPSENNSGRSPYEVTIHDEIRDGRPSFQEAALEMFWMHRAGKAVSPPFYIRSEIFSVEARDSLGKNLWIIHQHKREC